MMKKSLFTYPALAAVLIALGACERVEPAIESAERITFAPSVAHNVVTKAHSETPLNMGYAVGIYNIGYTSGAAGLKVRSACSYASSAYTFSPELYWDDASTDTYDVRSATGGVNIWAAQLAGRTYNSSTLSGTSSTSAVIIDDSGVLTWKIAADQSKTGAAAGNDLLVADYITSQKATLSPIALCFHHAMTKIDVNIIKGDGFSDSEFANVAVTLASQNTQSVVDLKKAVGDGTDSGMLVNSTAANVKMERMSTVATGAAVSLQAIVAPGYKCKSGDVFATLTIGQSPAVNSYSVKLSDEVLSKWGITTASDTLKHGVDYVLDVTVNKSEISLAATVTEWTVTDTAKADGIISFTADNINQGPTAGESAFDKAFTIYSSSAATGYTAGSTYKYSDGKWSTDNAMYWQSNADKRYFRTALYASSDANKVVAANITNDQVSGIAASEFADSLDLMWGTSGSSIYQPTVKDVKLTFSHVLSAVTVNVSTTDGADAIDLDQIKDIRISGTRISGGVLSLHNGTVNSEAAVADLTMYRDTKAGGDNYTGKKYLVLPQAISNDAKIIIDMKDGSTFSTGLQAIHKAAKTANGLAQTDAAWNQGEQYTYEINVKKSEIAFVASVKSWTTQQGGGDAFMDWD